MSLPPGVEAPSGEPAPPAKAEPINGIALAQEVVLDRLEHLLTWLLSRLQRYRARRGDWWER